MNTQPAWQHQKIAVERGVREGDLAIFFEIGTGKSRTAVDIIRHHCARAGRLKRVLIFSPKVTLTNWKNEFAKFSKISPRDVLVLTGSGKKRLKQFQDAVVEDHAYTRAKVVICNYETVEMAPVFQALLDWGPEIIVADEAHRLKNPESKRAKLVVQLGDKAEHCYPMTGTPILKSAMDIFQIFRFMDGGETFGRSFWKFRQVWFEDQNAEWSGKPGYFPKWEPRPETYAEFSKMIYKKAVRALKSECLDLPPLVRKEIHVELSPEQRRLYKEMKDEYIAYIDDVLKTDTPRAVVAQLAVTKALRMQQIVTGYAKDEDGAVHHIKDNPRLEALRDLLTDHAADHKIIVWSVFHENYDDISKVCRELGLDYRELHGRVPNGVRDANIKAFCNDPGVRVLIANQAAAGIGINLVESDISIYYSKNFSLADDLQSEGRNYRGGSEVHNKVTRIDLVATDTIDDIITQSLLMKQEIGVRILDLGDKL
jgi:SNF2 family DNA or RNA helicase